MLLLNVLLQLNLLGYKKVRKRRLFEADDKGFLFAGPSGGVLEIWLVFLQLHMVQVFLVNPECYSSKLAEDLAQFAELFE